MMETEFIVVLVTVGSRSEGEAIAQDLVRGGLAACVNILGPVRSVYVWKSEVAQDDEHLLVIKSRRSLFDLLERRVRSLHSYDVPEVVALPIRTGSRAYLAWLESGTSGGVA